MNAATEKATEMLHRSSDSAAGDAENKIKIDDVRPRMSFRYNRSDWPQRATL